MLFESHLALEVREDRLDHQADRGLGDLGGWTLAGAVAIWSDQFDRDELNRALILTPQKPLSAKSTASG